MNISKEDVDAIQAAFAKAYPGDDQVEMIIPLPQPDGSFAGMSVRVSRMRDTEFNDLQGLSQLTNVTFYVTAVDGRLLFRFN